MFVRGTSTCCVLGLSEVVATVTASDSVSMRASSIATSGVWDSLKMQTIPVVHSFLCLHLMISQ